MIELRIISTGKGYSKRDTWEQFDYQRKHFGTIGDAIAWIKDTYGKAKKQKMFIDTIEGSKHIGYVVGFRNSDMSHYPVSRWIQQDWIEFKKIEPIYL